MMLTFDFTPASSVASCRACSGESLTPASSTYSNVIRLRRFSVAAMSDAWLSDCTLYGSAGEVRDGVEAWLDAGVPYPILVPSSTSGGQLKAFEEIFAAFV